MLSRGKWLGLVLAAALATTACPAETRVDLGAARRIADGALLYRIDNPRLLEVPGPILVNVLRLDPGKVSVQSALAKDRVVALETVPAMAARTGALAAINAGFFAVRSGDPAGVLEVGDEFVSDSPLLRGAVGIIRDPDRPVRLVFDRVSATATVRYEQDGEPRAIAVSGVDTTRARGKLMLYTPSYGPDTDTAAGGVEWQIDGVPPRVVAVRVDAGKTPIPRTGLVLSFGGTVLPTALEGLAVGQEVTIDRAFQTAKGTLPDTWADADDIISGAGLLVYKGVPEHDWTEEQLSPGFTTTRHPRTVIGTSRNGTIWLITVDGRDPQTSIGMTFDDLQRLAQSLKLYYALNLDGGGSTTMVAAGAIVNHPSDATGPRPVSDGLIVTPRR